MLHYRLLLLVPFFLFLSYSKGQTIVQAGKEHNFTRYSVEDGLLDNNVFKVYQCSKGYIWACTPKGASRFDGINFKNYTINRFSNKNESQTHINTIKSNEYEIKFKF